MKIETILKWLRKNATSLLEKNAKKCTSRCLDILNSQDNYMMKI